ncbi:hypothetical protein [Pseudoalteromonas spongiae]|uniref:hypothetical protein n=1 Tax=Pseudoalteromonas spongiae TaxID=298657 RepID=UPI003735C598
MNYSSYSISELKESLETIDKDAYPDNYKKLIEELNSRKDEVQNYEKEQTESFIIKTENRLKIVTWLQAITAIAFIYAGFINFNSEQQTWVNIVPFCIAIFNGVASYYLFKREKLGFNLSIINQILQLLTVNLGFIYYSYSGLGYLMIVIQDGIALKANIFNPSYNILYGSGLGFGVGIDLLSLFFLTLLYSGRENLEQNKS